MHFHFNTCQTAVSIGKVIWRDKCDKEKPIRISISDITTEIKNRNFILRVFPMYGIDQKLIKNIKPNSEHNRIYQKLLNFGKIAA